MSNHSPAPWIVFHNVEIRCPGEDNTVIARMEDSREAGWNTPTINANARLIAAAPELLALLREMHDAVADGTADFSPSGDWFREASTAISKATGQEI